MDDIKTIKNLPDVSFIDDDTLEMMKTRMVNNFEKKYKEITGQEISLSKADPNRIMLNAIAAELYQIEQYIDRAGKQDLLKYSYGEFLDNLGAGRGVERKKATPATVRMRFTMDAARPNAIGIPQGSMVTNGDKYFTTNEYVEIAIGQVYAEVMATCTENGISGNELLPGQINNMVDLIPYISKVENVSKSANGSNLETDEEYADRIYLAPSAYSVAGPEDAYIYWAKSFSGDIGDVRVHSPSPVDVEIRILMNDRSLPDETTIRELSAFLQDKNIRPLTDRVTVKAPSVEQFDVSYTYYINRSDLSKAATIQEEVAKAVDRYIEWQTSIIGRDINPSQLVGEIMKAGAKRVTVTAPNYTQVDNTTVARLGTKTGVYGGIEND